MLCAPALSRFVLVGLLGLGLAAGVSGCGGTGDSSTVTVPSSVSSSPTSVRQLAVTVSNGTVHGDSGRVPVALGSTVHLTVTSDVADEVRSNLDDQMVDVPAGGTVSLDISADKPGSYEVELENSKLPLVRLAVQ